MKTIGYQRIVKKEVILKTQEDQHKLKEKEVVDPILKAVVKMPRIVVLRKTGNLPKSLVSVKRIT